MPHFFTLSSFSTATPRETSSVELPELLFDDPEREKKQCVQQCVKDYNEEVRRSFMGDDNEWGQCGHGDEPADTWVLLCVLGQSTGSCCLVVRQANTSGFHADVWNEDGDEKEWGWGEGMEWNMSQKVEKKADYVDWKKNVRIQNKLELKRWWNNPPCRFVMQNKRMKMDLMGWEVTTRQWKQSSKVHFTVKRGHSSY